MFFLSGKLWYRTESGFKFPVPIKGSRQSVFLNEDRAKRFIHTSGHMPKNCIKLKQHNFVFMHQHLLWNMYSIRKAKEISYAAKMMQRITL
jgi:hypothetical protein